MSISQRLIDQFNIRIYQENIPRIEKCLSMISEQQLWYRTNEEVNSIGHLILHLNGNVTQWIGSGIGQLKDDRNRDLEFCSSPIYNKEELIRKLHQLRPITDMALNTVTDDHLLESITVQGFQETPLSIIVHVIEHFSYHVGQIAHITKEITQQPVGFYEGVDLNTKN